MSESENSRSDTGGADEAVDSGRRGVLIGTAVLATGMGVGGALWMHRGAGAVPEPVPGFWASQWDRPQGGKLFLQSFRNKPLLLNFWATWCVPCIEELPRINDFYKANALNGWQVVAVAIDRMAPVQGFLKKTSLEFDVAVAGMSGLDLARGLGNMSGSLPFSVALDATGAVVFRKLGAITPEELAQLSRLK